MPGGLSIPATTSHAVSGSPGSVRGRILVVDDEDLFRVSTTELLRVAGFDCLQADSRGHALALLRERPVDVLVLDLMLGGEPQLELMQRIGAAPESPAVILVTGYPSIESAVSAADLGVSGYFVKPFEIDDLIERLDDGIRRRRLAVMLNEAESSLRSVSDRLSELARLFGAGGPHARSAAAALPDKELSDQLERLTPREHEITEELLRGYRVSTIGKRLGISENTVRRHLKSIFLKVEVGSQAELLERLKP